jgi:hypothetical protein
MAETPQIYSMLACPEMGSFGDDTEIEYFEPCPQCAIEPRPDVKFLEYRFDGWDGEELVCTRDRYGVTDNLRQALERASIVGVSFREMSISKSDMFLDIDPDDEVELPHFWEMIIESTCSGPSGWWEFEGICPTCGTALWEHTDRVVDALTSPLMGDQGPPRLVYRGSWKGEDVFFLDDPGPPLATERFARIIADLDVEGLELQPAEWVEGVRPT